jgi:hypothetical protein
MLAGSCDIDGLQKIATTRLFLPSPTVPQRMFPDAGGERRGTATAVEVLVTAALVTAAEDVV